MWTYTIEPYCVYIAQFIDKLNTYQKERGDISGDPHYQLHACLQQTATTYSVINTNDKISVKTTDNSNFLDAHFINVHIKT